MAKGGREKIKLQSSAGTGHFYTTDKNKKTTPDKLEIMKFDPEGSQARDVQGNQAEMSQLALTAWSRDRPAIKIKSGSPCRDPFLLADFVRQTELSARRIKRRREADRMPATREPPAT